MSEVRRAIHIRTGQRSACQALDAWLTRHNVEVTCFDDVYDACVHLLQKCDWIPDLALLGCDWLAEDEFGIIQYLRQTWPHVGVVAYGAMGNTPPQGVVPLMQTCRSPAALDDLLARSPAELLRQMRTQPAASPRPQIPPDCDSGACAQYGPQPLDATTHPQSGLDDPSLAGADPLHSILTPEELSALLDRSDEA